MSTTHITPLREKLMEKIDNNQLIISAYLTLGYPDIDTSIKAMIATAKAGADIIEIGLPFSDPMADGPTIQYTNQVALDNGLLIHDLEKALQQLRTNTDTSIIIMTYGNVIYQYPLDRFKQVCKDYSVDGVIIPDIPPEHAAEIVELEPIFLIAPNTNISRVSTIANKSTGFVYIVSKLGITGGDYDSDRRLSKIYETLEANHGDLPRLQGFGIDSKESVDHAMSKGAHGVIIGSKLLRLLGDKGNIKAIENFIQKIL